MADYGILVKDNLDGSFSLRAVNRGTTTTTFTGGTNLLTDTVTVTKATGLLATASGFLDTTNMTASSDSLGRMVTSVMGAVVKAGEICNNDRSFNG